MYYFDGIIVVEGKQDVSFLSSFIQSEYVITNGYDLPSSELGYLEAASSKKTIIVLTDSDSAGELIRSKINLPSSINIRVDLNTCNKRGKHGVAESSQEEIVNVLQEYLTKSPSNKEILSTSFLSSLGLSKKINRTFLAKKVPVGECNLKKLAVRLTTLEIPENEIKKIMEGKEDDN